MSLCYGFCTIICMNYDGLNYKHKLCLLLCSCWGFPICFFIYFILLKFSLLTISINTCLMNGKRETPLCLEPIRILWLSMVIMCSFGISRIVACTTKDVGRGDPCSHEKTTVNMRCAWYLRKSRGLQRSSSRKSVADIRKPKVHVVQP